jgi:hypothetical protein
MPSRDRLPSNDLTPRWAGCRAILSAMFQDASQMIDQARRLVGGPLSEGCRRTWTGVVQRVV